jgi:hypothetical protein
MNIRCFYCQTPFTLGRAELLAALQHMAAENLNHYDAHCPRCRRANSVARQRMEMVFPNWRQAAQEQAAPAPAPAPEKVESPASKKPAAAAEKKPAAAPSKSKAKAKPAAAKAKPAAKPAAKTRKK